MTSKNFLVGLVKDGENGTVVDVRKPLIRNEDVKVTTFRDLATILRGKYPGLLPDHGYTIFLKTQDIDGDVTDSQDRVLGVFVDDAMFKGIVPRVDFVVPVVESPPPPPPPPLPPRLTETPVSVDTTASSSSSLSREVLNLNLNNNNNHNNSNSSINSDNNTYVKTEHQPSHGLISASALQRQSSAANAVIDQYIDTSSVSQLPPPPYCATYPTTKQHIERRSTPMGHLLQLFVEKSDGEPYTKYLSYSLSDLGIHFKTRHNIAWSEMGTGKQMLHFLQSISGYFKVTGIVGGKGTVRLRGEHGTYELIGERSDVVCQKGSSEDLRGVVTVGPSINPSSNIRAGESRVVVMGNTTLSTTISNSYTTSNNNNNNNNNNSNNKSNYNNNDHSINNKVPSKGGRVVNLEGSKVDEERRRERSNPRDNNDRGRERVVDRDRDGDRDRDNKQRSSYGSSSSSNRKTSRSRSRNRSYRSRSSSSSRDRDRGRDTKSRRDEVSYETSRHPYGRTSPPGHHKSSSSSKATTQCWHFCKGNH